MLPLIKGKVAYVFEQPDFDVDLICGLSNYTITDPKKLKELKMSNIRVLTDRMLAAKDVQTNELLGCSDRLLVIHKGKIVAAFAKASEITEETLGEYMLGVKEMTPAQPFGRYFSARA